MSRTASPHWRLFASGFRSQSTYRLAMLAGFLTNMVFGFLKAAILLATVRGAGGRLGSYGVAQMSSFVWWGQGLLGAVNLSGSTELARRIKSGDVVVDLIRPVDLQASTMLREVGASTFTLLPRCVPMIALGALTIGMSAPASALCWVLAPLSLALALTVSSATRFALSTTGFWLVETRGVQLLYLVASGFLAGLFVPIQLFPGWLQHVANLTPFPSMLMSFLQVVSGAAGSAEALRLVAVQLAWLVGMVALGRLLQARGRARLEVQGG